MRPGTRLAELVHEDRLALEAHVGGSPTATQRRAIEDLLVLDLLVGAAAAHLQEVGFINEKKSAYRIAALQLGGFIEKRRRLMESLGWRAVLRQVEDVDTWLKGGGQ